MKLIDKIRNGERTAGTFLNLGSAVAAECAAIAGFDYVIIDLEHSQFGFPEAADMIKTAALRGMPALVRVPEISRAWILKLLDAGAGGIVVPGLKTKEEAERLVQLSKYPGLGSRGFCPTRVCDFGYGDAFRDGILSYAAKTNRDTMMIPQCETVECLESIEEIVSMEGIDGIFIGPFDLSLALGIPAEFSRKEFTDAIEHIKDVCIKHGKPVFIFAPDQSTAAKRMEEGYTSVTISADLNILIDSFRAVNAALKK